MTRHLSVVPGAVEALRVGDTLDSDAATTASIQFTGGSVSTMGPNARLIMSQLEPRTGSSPLVIAMHLERGAMRSAVAGLRPNVDKFGLRAPGLMAYVKGTVFRVDVSPSTTYLATDEGVVHVKYDGETALVPAGAQLEVLLEESKSVVRTGPQAPLLALVAPLPFCPGSERRRGTGFLHWRANPGLAHRDHAQRHRTGLHR